MITLTPFQIFVVMGFSNPDEEGLVEYKIFASKAKEFINANFNIDSLVKTAKNIH